MAWSAARTPLWSAWRSTDMLDLYLLKNSAGHLAGDRPTLVYPKTDHEPASFTILNFPVDDIEAAVPQLKG